MNEERFTELVIKITSELASLNSNMKCTLERLANHETRLMELERNKTQGFKDEVVRWLIKGLLIALGIIATSAGAGAVLKPILGM